MTFIIDGVLERTAPRGGPAALVVGSPHSGTCYPADFSFSCPPRLLREAEDLFVDDLIAEAPAQGAALLRALFPRSYIDVNRALDDLDPAWLDRPWSEPLAPSERSRFGQGLIRTLCADGTPIYDHPLSIADVARRIERYYLPYHYHLGALIEESAHVSGVVWHLDCHSMPSTLQVGQRACRLPDFVLGDRHGTTCTPRLTTFVRHWLETRGYRVTINDPFAGAEIVRRFGAPARGRHSLQLEINRALYMDEATLCRHDGFDRLKRTITALIGDLCALAETACSPAALAAE